MSINVNTENQLAHFMAVQSSDSNSILIHPTQEWIDAMDEEMKTLRDNNTFTLTTLPESKKAVGGRC